MNANPPSSKAQIREAAVQGKTYLGVYSIRAKDAAARKRLFFVWADGDGGYIVQLLDGAYRPTGPLRSVNFTLFQGQFVYEPSILVAPLSVGQGTDAEPGARDDRTDGLPPPMDAPASPSPSQPSGNAASDAKEVENYLRSHFNKAMRRIKRPEERTAALESLKTLADVEEGIVPEHKHMFTDFGITLRKNELLELALSCSRRVLDLSPDDDHAHFNIARILYEMGRVDDAEQHLLAALDLAPDAIVCIKMLKYIQKQRRLRGKPQRTVPGSRRSCGRSR